jgi:hypothetical protein
MVVPAGRDHRWQLARAIRDGKRLIDAWPAHGRESFDLDFGQFDFVIDLGRVAERAQRLPRSTTQLPLLDDPKEMRLDARRPTNP